MRIQLLFFFCLAPMLAVAQTPDSFAIRRVDSLVQVSRTLAGRQDFAQSFEAIAAAEKLALSTQHGMGRESDSYGKCCHTHGVVCYFKGDYSEAEFWYREALAIREKVLGKEHADYSATLNNLAILYEVMGKYEKAEPLYQESISIKEKTLGRVHADYCGSMVNLAILYYKVNNYARSEDLLLEAKAIFEVDLDNREHPFYTVCLNSLGVLYERTGQYQKAKPLYLEVLNLRETSLGKEHPVYCGSLVNLANLHRNMGHYEQSEAYLLEARAIFENRLNNRTHPFYLNCLEGLGILYYLTGQYEKAELVYLECRAAREKIFGKEHPQYAGILLDLAALYQNNGQYEKAAVYFTELAQADKKLLTSAVHYLSERELNDYLTTFSINQYRLLSFAQKRVGETADWLADSAGPDIRPWCYDDCLFYKGFLLNSAGQIKRLALSNAISEEKYNLLKNCERRLAAEYGKPVERRKNVLELEEEANRLEKDLARTVAGFGEAIRQVKWQEVQKNLKPGEAALEFVRFQYFERIETDSIMYAVLLLLPGSGDSSPRFIPLFEEKSLDAILQVHSVRRSDYVNSIYNATGGRKKSLYQLIWQPLENQLGDIHTLYFAPSGLLHRINIPAIYNPQGSTLADRYRFVELGSTRQLVVGAGTKIVNQEALLIGGVHYELDRTAIARASTDVSMGMAGSRGDLVFSNSDSTLRGAVWSFLPWTEKEVDVIGPLLGNNGMEVTLRKGYDATESAFKRVGRDKPSPRILHIATHGYFFPDPKAATGHEPVFKASDHPMIRSGLILAGGNYVWSMGQSSSADQQEDIEDGILTAYEISQMNLSNTELVVLSACETGLGDIEGNEGVYGLQRAFKIAGVKYLIMSLWQVPDVQTQELMTVFYQKWLEEKRSIPDAFRAAQKEMKERYLNPYFWAGFVLVE